MLVFPNTWKSGKVFRLCAQFIWFKKAYLVKMFQDIYYKLFVVFTPLGKISLKPWPDSVKESISRQDYDVLTFRNTERTHKNSLSIIIVSLTVVCEQVIEKMICLNLSGHITWTCTTTTHENNLHYIQCLLCFPRSSVMFIVLQS